MVHPTRKVQTSSIGSRPSTDEDERCRVMSAAADPIRMRILSLLRQPRSVRDICEALDMAQPRVSHHLAVLRAAGLLDVEPRGRMRLYAWAPLAEPSALRDVQLVLKKWLEKPGSAPSRPNVAAAGAPGTSALEDFLL